MSTSRSRSNTIDAAGVLRRLVHLAILIGIVVGVRTCGGTASTEYQLGAGTQWFAEQTGLVAVKERWDKSIRPPIAAVTTAASDSFYRGVSRTMDDAAVASDQAQQWIADTSRSVVDAFVGSLRSFFVRRAESPTVPQQDPSARQEQRPSVATP